MKSWIRHGLIRRGMFAAALSLSLAACVDQAAQQREAAQAAQQQREHDAAQLQRQYEMARSAQQWRVAFLHGNALLKNYADTQVAALVKPSFDEVKAKADAKREADRLSSLWTYAQVPVAADKGKPGGTQYSAMIDGKDNVDVDGSGPRTVQLVFRDHPQWKRSAYLVLQNGDFAKACYTACNVKVKTDDGKRVSMAAYRPDTKEAIAMFIKDDKALWKLARNNKSIEIEFATRDLGAKKVLFETGGVNAANMPKSWN